MKKINLLITFVLISMGATAQEASSNDQKITITKDQAFQTNDSKNINPGKFHIGTAYGRNLIFIINQTSYYRPELEYRPTFGNNFGLAAGYDFNEFLGLQVELYYSQQGQNYKDEDYRFPTLTREVKTSYLQIPMMVKFMGGPSAIRFYAMGGVQYSKLLSSSVTIDGVEYQPDNVVENIKATRFFEQDEWGAKFATGADFRINEKWYLNAGLAFYGGLTDMNAPYFRRNGHAFSKKPYHMSTNAYAGGNIGIHYIIPAPHKRVRF